MSNTLVGFRFWLQWVMANTAGTALGWIAGSQVTKAIGYGGPFSMSTTGILTILGATVGLSQWLVLRKKVRAIWWIIGNAVAWPLGWPVGFAISFFIALFLPFPIFWVVHGAVLGTVIGLVQWLGFRRKVTRASQWILASAVAGAVGYVMSWVLRSGISKVIGAEVNDYEIDSILMTTFGAISGAITGGILVMLLQQSIELERH